MSKVLGIVFIVGVVLLLLAAIAALLRRRRRRNALQEQFGPEYDHAVSGGKSRRKAEKDLEGRSERRAQLEISPLPAASAERYRGEWRMLQERFVDAPAESVTLAHSLIQSAMSERGYPTDDRDERVSMLSVDHGDVLERYRKAEKTEKHWHDSGDTSTEQLRQAMQDYRAVFQRVVGEQQGSADSQSGAQSR